MASGAAMRRYSRCCSRSQTYLLTSLTDGLRHTPIALAIQLGHLGIAKKLIAHGVDLGRRSEPEGMTLLHKSCWAGHLEMTQLLLDTGRFAQLLETKDKAGRTPLHLASFRAPEQVCRMLIAAGANPMTKEARGSMPSNSFVCIAMRVNASRSECIHTVMHMNAS